MIAFAYDESLILAVHFSLKRSHVIWAMPSQVPTLTAASKIVCILNFIWSFIAMSLSKEILKCLLFQNIHLVQFNSKYLVKLATLVGY